MSRFVDFRNPLTPTQLEMERLVRQERITSSVQPHYFSEGVPSFNPPSSNIITNLMGKAAEGSIALGTGAGVTLNSGFGLLARQAFPLGDNNIPLSKDDTNAYMSDGTMKPLGDIKGVDYFNALEPSARFILSENGVTDKQFSDIDNIEDASERYNQIIRDIELRQQIVRYNEVHPNFATATGIVGFALEAVTDPITIATLGTGVALSGTKALGSQAARIGVRELSQEAMKTFAEKGLRHSSARLAKTVGTGKVDLVPSMIRNATDSSRVMTHLLATAGGGGAVLSYDALAQLAEHDRRVDVLGIQEEFDYSFSRGAVSFALGAGLGNLGALARGGRVKTITNKDVIEQASPTSIIGRRTANKARTGSAADDAAADLKELTVLERIDKWSDKAYDRDGVKAIQDVLTHAIIVSKDLDGNVKRVTVNDGSQTEFDLDELSTFFEQGPSVHEAMDYLTTGIYTEPEVSRINKSIRTKVDRLGELRGGDVNNKAVAKEIKKISRQITTLENTKDRIINGGTRIVDGEVEVIPRGYFFTPHDPEADKLRAIVDDAPARDVYNNKRDRMPRMNSLLGLTPESAAPASAQVAKATTKLFTALASVGSLGTLGRSSDKLAKIGDNPIAQALGKMYSAFDTRIANDLFSDDNGSSITSVLENLYKVQAIKGKYMIESSRLLKGMSKEQRAEIGGEVAMLRTKTKGPSEVSETAVALAKSVDTYYERMGEMALANGSLKKKIDNYMNVLLRDDLTGDEISGLATKLATWWRSGQYGTGVDSELHLGTLSRMKIIDENRQLLDSDYKVQPTTFGELTPADQKTYADTLDSALGDEASFAIQRRLGRNKSVAEDPVVRDEGRKAIYRQDNRASRIIEQEFWYSDEVVKSGVLNTDLDEMVGYYERTFGGYIARQETMTEIFGEAARFDDFIEVARNKVNALSGDDPNKTLLLKSIEDLEELNQRTLHHVKPQATGVERVLQPLVDVASATIQQGITIAMQTEVATIVLRNMFHKNDISNLMSQMRQIFNGGATKEDLLAWGFTHEYEKTASRYLGESAIDPVGSVGKGARWWREAAREYFGEAALTRRLKRLHYVSTYGKTSRKLLKVLDRLDQLDQKLDPTDPKALTTAARSAGFGSDAGLAAEIRRVGLHTPAARRALARFKEVSPDSLRHPESAMKVALSETDEALRKDMVEVVDNLRRVARQSTDNYVVTRSGGTQLRSNDVLGNTLFQFLTYPSSWFNGFLRQASNNSNQALAGYLVTYLIGESMASMGRDIALKGMSPEEVIAEWEENFYDKAAVTASRMPILGAFSDLAYAPIIAATTDNKFRLGLSTNPAISFPERVGGEAIRNYKKMVAGEDLSREDWKNTMKVIPGFGFPVSSALVNQK
tara:strand:+ start:2441 stop:6574 length:4134 start_codon:yes stop_codon:yes gene_type:complete